MTEIRQIVLVTLSLLVLLLFSVRIGHARHNPLPAPTTNSCVLSDLASCPTGGGASDGYCVDWSEVVEAFKYSVQFECTDSTTVVELDIGTGDRIDGGQINDHYLFVTFEELNAAASAVTGGIITNLSGFTCEAKVKALNPPSADKPNGHQSNLFSPVDSCGLIP